MSIAFCDRDYIWTHGKAPRGRGFWWFFFEGQEFSACGTFTEAKKACIAHVRSVAPAGYKGHVIVKVGT